MGWLPPSRSNQPTNPLGTYKEYTRVFTRIGKGSKPPEETSKLFLSLAQVDELCETCRHSRSAEVPKNVVVDDGFFLVW